VLGSRPSLDNVFMETALLFARRSTCCRKQVGAVLVKEKRIIATGYNGSVGNATHCYDYFHKMWEERGSLIDFCKWVESEEFKILHFNEFSMYEVHAEENVLCFCNRHGILTEGTVLYSTLSPCVACSKRIIQSGIKGLMYLDYYDRPESVGALELLRNNGVQVFQYEE